MISIYGRLNSAIDKMEENLFEDIDVNKICRILELNSNLASSVFELFTGYTIKDYIRKRRLSEAVFLLQKERIIDVAITCGYNTRESFSRAFRAFHGYNPSKFTDKFNYLEKIHFDEKLITFPIKNYSISDF